MDSNSEVATFDELPVEMVCLILTFATYEDEATRACAVFTCLEWHDILGLR